MISPGRSLTGPRETSRCSPSASNLGAPLVTPTRAAVFPPAEPFATVIKAGSKLYLSALFLHP